jgi:hypothetical protein
MEYGMLDIRVMCYGVDLRDEQQTTANHREAPALCAVPDREERRRPVLARMDGDAGLLTLYIDLSPDIHSFCASRLLQILIYLRIVFMDWS